MSEAAASVLHAIDGAVGRVTINRPEARNALSPEVMDGLQQAFARAAADPPVRGVVLTGAGDEAFCAGGDLGGRAFQQKGFRERHEDRRAFGTEDAIEGVRAFLEKRDPVWKGQ